MGDIENERLTRIETKIDNMASAVTDLSITTAVIHEKVNDLEIRRQESHERANRMSSMVDELHNCVHGVEQHVGKVEGQLGLTTKILMVCTAAIIGGVANLIFNIV